MGGSLPSERDKTLATPRAKALGLVVRRDSPGKSQRSNELIIITSPSARRHKLLAPLLLRMRKGDHVPEQVNWLQVNTSSGFTL